MEKKFNKTKAVLRKKGLWDQILLRVLHLFLVLFWHYLQCKQGETIKILCIE